MDLIQRPEDLKNWLEGKPAEWSRLLAMRTGLRVLPLACQILSLRLSPPWSIEVELVLQVFRTAFIGWVARAYTTNDVNEHARQAVKAASIALDKCASMMTGDSAEKHSYNTRLIKATTAVIVGTRAGYQEAHAHAQIAARDASIAAESVAPDNGYSTNWKAITADAGWLAEDHDTSLAEQPLWLIDVRGDEKYRVNFPIWIRNVWDTFKREQRPAREAGFTNWFPWYEARLRGESGFRNSSKPEETRFLAIEIATQPEEFWSRDSTIVNADVKEIISQAEDLKKPFYNLIVMDNPQSWRTSILHVDRPNFPHSTTFEIANRFRSLSPAVIDRLIRIPTLFLLKGGDSNEAARIGQITKISVYEDDIKIQFQLNGGIPPITNERFAEIRERLEIGPTERNYAHWSIKNVDLYSVLNDTGIAPEEPREIEQPPEPAPGPGPQYSRRNGKLSEDITSPSEGEAARQRRLHQRLKAEVGALRDGLRSGGNQFPELAGAMEEYAELLNPETAELDVTGVWSVGGALAAFSRSYREQNSARTLSEPLEPQIDARLQNVVRQHGAFILGFEEGRDLVQRADEFALDSARLIEIEPSGNALLNELTDNRNLVDDRTRALHRPVRDSATELGWAGSRVGYSAYVIVRNGVRAMIKFAVGEDPNIGAILGVLTGASVLAGDPNAAFIRAAVPVLQQHGTQLLAFFNHSPEMYAYVEWALRILDADRNDRESINN